MGKAIYEGNKRCGEPLSMPSTIDFEQEQADEVAALSEIWPGFSTLAKAWGKHEYSVRIAPSLPEAEVFTRITVIFSLPAKYPLVAPVLRLEAAQNLTEAHVRELLSCMLVRAQRLAGDTVYMHDLLMIAQEFVSSHNRSPAKSLWESMQSAERKVRLMQINY